MMPLNPLAAPQLAPRSARLSERERARCTRRCRAKARPSLRPTGLHGSSPFSLTSSGSTNCDAKGHELEEFVTFVFVRIAVQCVPERPLRDLVLQVPKRQRH